MKPWIVFLLTISLSGCAVQRPAGILPPTVQRDPWGNVYPTQYTRQEALAAAKKLTIIDVDNLPIARNTSSRCGFFDPRFDPPIILVLKHCTVNGRRITRDEILIHEGYHALAGEWHGAHPLHPQ